MDRRPNSDKAPRRALIYLRVSTKGDRQDVRAQLGALRPFVKARGWTEVGVERDNVTGDPTRRKGDPPGLSAAMRRLAAREADVLVVFSADRLVRSPVHLLQLVERVQAHKAHVVSMQDGHDLDTTSDVGELLVFLRGWWSRMEAKLIRARVRAGLDRARARGVKLGRKRLADGIDTKRLVRARKGGASWATLTTMFEGASSATIRRRHAEAIKAAKEGN
jgi:DNA invertase Pin-like site-specific DNA recombinase